MLDERYDTIDNELIEEVGNVQIGDVVVDKVEFKDVEKSIMPPPHLTLAKPKSGFLKMSVHTIDII